MVDDEPAGRSQAPGSQAGTVAVAGQDEQPGAFGRGDDLPLDGAARGPGRRRRAIDADINRHPAEAPGASQPPPLGGHLAEIKEYLHGTNHRIGSAAAMVKTARVI